MIKKNLFFLVLLIFLSSCAKPTVVEIIQEKDDSLNCEQLKDEIAEVQKIKEDAEYSKDTGGNMTRAILFWPAWAKSLHNADEAILAANNRNFHLIKLMKKNNCKDTEKIQISLRKDKTKIIEKNDIAEQLKIINEMYESGNLTEEEYIKAKKKIID